MRKLKPCSLLMALSFLLPSCLLLALALGAIAVPFGVLIQSVFYPSAGSPFAAIIMDIRLPRVLLSACVGSILAVSGAVMQGLFRNPLADPSLIGVTAGAFLGASLAIVIGGFVTDQWLGLPMLFIASFLGGMIAVMSVYHLACRGPGVSVATMLLAGIAIAALAGSISGVLEFLADNYELRRISLWRMGSLEGADYWHVLFAFVLALLLNGVFLLCSQQLNALLLGESEARHLGINVERLKRLLIVLVALGVGVSVALVGAIGFIGLVVPHMVRLLIGPDHRFLLPAASLLGAILLVLADTLSRVILAPTELPVGLVTALIGVPFFISLLTRRNVYGLT